MTPWLLSGLRANERAAIEVAIPPAADIVPELIDTAPNTP